MRLYPLCFIVLLLVSCGEKKSSNNVLEIQETEVTEKGREKSLPESFMTSDSRRIPDLLPSMYYTPTESSIRCKGGYGSSAYNGKETQKLLTKEGKYIATVCKRFANVLLMEGSAILKDRGAGEIAVNYSRKVNGQARYHVLDRCKFGEGVRNNLCLLPYHTIAADNKVHKKLFISRPLKALHFQMAQSMRAISLFAILVELSRASDLSALISL